MLTTIEVLEHALYTKRQANSLSEAVYVSELIALLPVTAIDSAGNIHVDLRVDKTNRTLFTAHTDTCSHSKGAINKVTKSATHYSVKDDVLGADDGAGIALLYALISAEVPGYYIFTRQEECGGYGGQYLADEMPDLLEQFDRAIAFDRRGTSDVVYQMAVGKTGSLEFAEALSDALNDRDMLYMPSIRGSFTDVANWIEYIPECVNISCGYMNEHSSKETLDIIHFNALAKAIVGIEWDKLPVVRMTCVIDDYEDIFYDCLDKACDGNKKPLVELAANRYKEECGSMNLNERRLDYMFLDSLYSYEIELALDMVIDKAYVV